MLIELKGHLDGEEVKVIWHDGSVEGDAEALGRISQVSAAARLDPDQLDPVAFLRCVDDALGGRLACVILQTPADPRELAHGL